MCLLKGSVMTNSDGLKNTLDYFVKMHIFKRQISMGLFMKLRVEFSDERIDAKRLVPFWFRA